MTDPINPAHYKDHPCGVEVIELTELLSFRLGNAVKYVLRHKAKNGVEDLRKAQWYLNRIQADDRHIDYSYGSVFDSVVKAVMFLESPQSPQEAFFLRSLVQYLLNDENAMAGMQRALAGMIEACDAARH
jgi:hypothetical protein